MSHFSLFASRAPLPERMRPESLEQIIGQEHITGEKGILQKAIRSGVLPSIILWGNPGTGKTTIANIITKAFKRPFQALNAINAGVKDVREVIEEAHRKSGMILFIDEIHRFNKTQQDALLHAVEKGVITLIGATTENPYFEMNPALISRCQVYALKPLTPEKLVEIMWHAIKTDVYLKEKSITLTQTEALLRLADGDARKLLNLLELVVETSPDRTVCITDALVMETAQQKIILYDKDGEQHYDIISAFIKSLRGSDPNAAVYWLARMLEGGEDPKFIARRMLILASEDIGNANPNALLLATNCFQAVTYLGMPEARIVLSQTAIYLASSAKSNASYVAIDEAIDAVRQSGNLAVPLHLRNAPTPMMREQGYGKGYQYAHDFENNFVQQEFMPDAMQGRVFYNPGKNHRENELRERLKMLWKEKYGY